jgi:hypothetical protein
VRSLLTLLSLNLKLLSVDLLLIENARPRLMLCAPCWAAWA